MPPASRAAFPPGKALGLCLSIVLVMAGCDSNVALGTQCPPVGRRCVSVQPPPRSVDAGTVPMAGEGDGGTGGGDAGATMPGDASTGVGDDWFVNGSFELTAGSEGNLDADGLGAMDDTRVDPWVACREPTSVVTQADARSFGVGEPTGMDLILPNDGATFVRSPYPSLFGGGGSVVGSELSQELQTPLQAGRTYAFTIDLAAASVNADILILQVYAGDAVCDTRTLLGTSDIVPDREGWRRACFEFTVDEPAATLTLAPRAVVLVAPDTRLFMDNMRAVSSCP